MSRSHKARLARYRNHGIWFAKNVKFAARPSSPAERSLSIASQLKDQLAEMHEAKEAERVSARERETLLRLTFDILRELEDEADDMWNCFVESDSTYDARDFDYEDRHDSSYDAYDDWWGDSTTSNVPKTDRRWVDEYLHGAETGVDDPDDRDDYGIDMDIEDEWVRMADAAFRNIDPVIAIDLVGQRERERLKAGNRYFRSSQR